MNMRFISVVLLVKDINASRSFYETLLKQQVDMDLGLNISYKGGFALWQAGHALEVIHGKPVQAAEANGAEQFEMYLESDDLDEALNEAHKAGVEFAHEIVEQPWGQRVFRIYDPDRYLIEIAEPMDMVALRLFNSGMSVLEISRKTAFPDEAVKAILEKYRGK